MIKFYCFKSDYWQFGLKIDVKQAKFFSKLVYIIKLCLETFKSWCAKCVVLPEASNHTTLKSFHGIYEVI